MKTRYMIDMQIHSAYILSAKKHYFIKGFKVDRCRSPLFRIGGACHENLRHGAGLSALKRKKGLNKRAQSVFHSEWQKATGCCPIEFLVSEFNNNCPSVMLAT